MKIALLPNFTKDNSQIITEKTVRILLNFGAKLLVLKDAAEKLDIAAEVFSDTEEIIKNCDICVVIGGDGTTIHYARIAAKYEKEVLGINAGRVGYISELENDELSLLSKLFEDYKTEDRMLLYAEIISDGTVKAQFSALNDLVISRGSLSQIVDFDVKQKDGESSFYRADGLIFSTPTGSTAYSFSAGGPVVDPKLKCILLSPVCAHLPVSARTIVFSSDSELLIKASSQSNRIYLTADGDTSYRIEEGDIIKIKKADFSAKFIKLKDRSFYTTVNEKLIGG